MCALVAVTVMLGLRTKPSDHYHTYFDESVQGLDEGAVVKYRGVRIGKVVGIGVAPDRRLIDVELAIDRGRARASADGHRDVVASGARAVWNHRCEAHRSGLLRCNTLPPPSLAFRAAEHYIPSRPSMLGALGDDVTAFARRLPTLADRALAMLDDLERASGDVRSFIAVSRTAVASVERVARSADRANVPDALTTALTSLDELGRRTPGATREPDTLSAMSAMPRARRALSRNPQREPT